MNLQSQNIPYNSLQEMNTNSESKPFSLTSIVTMRFEADIITEFFKKRTFKIFE